MAAQGAKPAVHRIAITKARINLGQVVRRVHTNNECFILEKDGIPVAGIIDVDELEDYLETKDPKLARQVREGYVAYESGKSRPLDDFLADLEDESSSRKK